MTREERMKEIMKEYPDFGKGVGYKMCIVDELDTKKKYITIGRRFGKTGLVYHTIVDSLPISAEKKKKLHELYEKLLKGERRMEKSILEMVGGEKHLNPHYDIKAESTSCYPATVVEINGVRFSSVSEMLQYMDKQREQLKEAKQIIRTFLNMPMPNDEEVFADVGAFLAKAEKFLREE